MTEINLIKIASEKNLPLKEVKRLYRIGLKNLNRGLLLYNANEECKDCYTPLKISNFVSIMSLLPVLCNDEVVKKLEVHPFILLYIIKCKKYKAEKILKLPKQYIKFIRESISM